MIVVAYGAGVNSTAMLVEAVSRRLPRPDLILFADTGGELPETYEYLDYFSAWLSSKGFPEIKTVHKVTRDGERLTLEDDCLQKKMLPSIVYGYKTCSQKYKIQPQDKFVNNHAEAQAVWKGGGLIEKWVGFDAGEERRAKIEADKKYRYRYPLIEWGLGRDQCLSVISAAGLRLNRKSSCFFCPNSKPKEVIWLRDHHPKLFNRAITMEGQANLTSLKGLARNHSWKQIISDFDNQLELFHTEKEMPCGCYDGE